MNGYMGTGSSGILIMGIILFLAASIIYSFMYSIPRNVKRIADTLEAQNAAMRESFTMLAGAVRQSSVSASMQMLSKLQAPAQVNTHCRKNATQLNICVQCHICVQEQTCSVQLSA